MQLPLTIGLGARGRSEPLLHCLRCGLGFVHHDALRQGVRVLAGNRGRSTGGR
jgi:hypothetical protein